VDESDRTVARLAMVLSRYTCNDGGRSDVMFARAPDDASVTGPEATLATFGCPMQDTGRKQNGCGVVE
jgi:hypothetical protein